MSQVAAETHKVPRYEQAVLPGVPYCRRIALSGEGHKAPSSSSSYYSIGGVAQGTFLLFESYIDLTRAENRQPGYRPGDTKRRKGKMISRHISYITRFFGPVRVVCVCACFLCGVLGSGTWATLKLRNTHIICHVSHAGVLFMTRIWPRRLQIFNKNVILHVNWIGSHQFHNHCTLRSGRSSKISELSSILHL